MSGSRDGFVWDDEMVQRTLRAFDGRVERAIVAGCMYTAPQMEADMKTSAPWNDITGNARGGLNAQVSSIKNGARITAAHGVPYGIFLEVRFGGKYSTVTPAIERWFPKAFETIMRLVAAR